MMVMMMMMGDDDGDDNDDDVIVTLPPLSVAQYLTRLCKSLSFGFLMNIKDKRDDVEDCHCDDEDNVDDLEE